MTTLPREASRNAYPPKIRVLNVVSADTLSATMRRFVLTGDELEAEFPVAPLTTATHVKIVVPQEETGTLVMPSLGERGLIVPEGVELAVRDYTVRGFDPGTRRLTLDFVLHDHGPAGRWAIRAQVGDSLGVMGPRGFTIYPDGYARYVLGADETSLPALERWLEEAPAEASLDAFVAAPASGKRQLPVHPGLKLHWVDDLAPAALVAALIEASPADDGDTFVWAAGESGIVAPLRRHLAGAGYDRAAFDVSGYWRSGSAGSGDHDEEVRR